MSLGRMSLKIVLGADVSGLRTALAKALSYLGSYRQAIAAINKQYPGLIMNVSAAVAYYSSLGFTVKRAVDHARDFEFYMFRIKSLFAAVQSATEDVTEAYEDMRKEALKIGRTTVYSASQAADAMGKLIEAGFTSAEAIRAVGDVLKFAAISGLSLERASIIAVQILRAFGMEAEQLNKALGVMTIAAVESTGRISDMALSLGYVAGVAGELGLSIEETAMWVGLLTNVLTTTVGTFMQAGKAGRYLRTLLMQLSDPDVVRRLEAIGIQIWDESGERMRSLTEIIQDFRELAGQMTKRELFWLTDQLGLSQVAATALYYAMRADTSVVGRFQKELQDVSDWQRIYYERSQSLNWELQRLKNITDVLWITMGESMLPAVHRMVEAFARLGKTGSPIEGLIRGIGNGISETLLDPLSQAVDLFADLSDNLDEAGVPLEDFGEAIGHLAVVMPVLLLIGKYIHPGLAVALGLAYVAWKTNFLGMRDALEPLLVRLKKDIPRAIASIIIQGKFLSTYFEDLWRRGITAIADWAKAAAQAGNLVVGGAGLNVKRITEYYNNLLKNTERGTKATMNETKESLEGFEEKWRRIKEIQRAFWEGLISKEEALDKIAKIIGGIEDRSEKAANEEASQTEGILANLEKYRKMNERISSLYEKMTRDIKEGGRLNEETISEAFALLDKLSKEYEGVAGRVGEVGEQINKVQEASRKIREPVLKIGKIPKEEFETLRRIMPTSPDIEDAIRQFEAWRGIEAEPGIPNEALPNEGAIIHTNSVVNIENLNVETPYDIDAMASELGYLAVEELRRRGIQID